MEPRGKSDHTDRCIDSNRFGDGFDCICPPVEHWPPISSKTLRKLIAYSFRDMGGYAGLTKAEQAILSVKEFEALRDWALERKAEG